MSNNNNNLIKQRREIQEFNTLFKNPKHAREMWADTIVNRLARPAQPPIVIVDKDGTPTPQSQLEQAVWNNLLAEFKEAGLSRPPTGGEFMEACQDYYARHSGTSYTARRDSVGAKPIDESKQTHTVNNPYADLTDEQLMVMQEALEQHEKDNADNIIVTADSTDADTD